MTNKESKFGGNIHQAHLQGIKKILIWGVDFINKLLRWT